MRQTLSGPEAAPARLGTRLLKAAGLVVLALIYLVAVPFWFAVAGYILGVLINASVLSFISLGVWLTFSIGRINIARAPSR